MSEFDQRFTNAILNFCAGKLLAGILLYAAVSP